MSYVVIATWRAKPGQADHIRKILETLTPISRAEPKVLSYQAHISLTDPDLFVMVEKYTDPSGYEDHRASEPFQSYVVGEALPNLAERNVQAFEDIG
ncbi:MAG TPA: putative quinol monooxygenase [Pseudonocardiaceae bacterium]